MRLDRPHLLADLVTFSRGGSGIVVGAPGSGKSHLLRDFATQALENDEEVLFLPVDQLLAQDEEALASELGTGSWNDFVAGLSAVDRHPATILIDAFDAARSADVRAFWLRVIRRLTKALGDNWHVIVSVRIYDARKSSDLQDLFPSASAEGMLRGDILCRHFWVPLLTEDEVDAAIRGIVGPTSEPPRLSRNLVDVLDTPFKVWLLERVVHGGASSHELTELESEIGLLTLFWKQRVDTGASAENKQILLTRIVAAMIDRHTLTVSAAALGETSTSASALADLLSAEVLVARSSALGRLSFGHNLLFDYAVAVLIIPADVDSHTNFLAEDLERLLFLRPSFHYFYALLWHRDHGEFWTLLTQLSQTKAARVRFFSRLVPVAVVASEARNIEHLAPLLADPERGPIQRKIIQWLLQALQAFGVSRSRLWAEFAAAAARHPHQDFAWDLTLAIDEILDSLSEPDGEGPAGNCGRGARLLLEWVWQARSENPSLDVLGSRRLVTLIIRTYATDLAASQSALMPILDLTTEGDFPIDYFFQLSYNAESLSAHDPTFLARLYQTVFSHSETSTDKTPMGTYVIPMVSNRRQDFESCRYALATFFPSFIERAGVVAFTAGLIAVNAYVFERHVYPYRSANEDGETFDFAGVRARILRDGSYIWGDDVAHEVELQMANHLMEYIRSNTNDAGQLDALMKDFSRRAIVGFLWKSLIGAAAKSPRLFISYIPDLLTSRPLLKSLDTLVEVGSLLEVSMGELGIGDRVRVENTIMSLSSETDDELTDRLRGRLIARINASQLTTDEAKAFRKRLEEAGPLPTNEPLVQFEGFHTEPYSVEHWLADEGVDVKEQANKTLLDASSLLEAFSTTWQNQVPSPSDVMTILPDLKTTRAMLKMTSPDAKVLETVWTRVAAAAKTAARGVTADTPDSFQLLTDLLLEASRLPVKAWEDDSFEHPAWSPTARTEAAQGLPWLALRAADSRVLNAIADLAGDQSTAVRYLIASELWRFRNAAPEKYWDIVNERAKLETNPVVQQALCLSLGRSVRDNPEAVVDTLSMIVTHHRPADGSRAWNSIFSLTFYFAFFHENKWANAFLESVLAGDSGELLRDATQEALDYLRREAVVRPDSKIEQAASWIGRAVQAACRLAQRIELSENAGAPPELLRTVFHIIDDVVTRLHLTLDPPGKDETALDEAVVSRFYAGTAPVIEKVLAIVPQIPGHALPAATTHHVLEYLNAVLSRDSGWAVEQARLAAQAGESGGYSLDPMGIREIVTLVERILADHRQEIRGPDLENLVDLLDIFVRAGWKDALLLVWRLDEVYR